MIARWTRLHRQGPPGPPQTPHLSRFFAGCFATPCSTTVLLAVCSGVSVTFSALIFSGVAAWYTCTVPTLGVVATTNAALINHFTTVWYVVATTTPGAISATLATGIKCGVPAPFAEAVFLTVI